MKLERLFVILLALVLVLALPLTASAEEVASGTCGDNLTWVLDDSGTLTISGTGAMADYATDSEAPWYSQRESIKGIVVENGVTGIGDYAFSDCDSLTEITIPDSVTSIGDDAFYDCYSLVSVTIGNSVTSIGNGAFSYCYSLVSVTIGNSVTSIGNGAFCVCDSLVSVSIPDGVTTIGNYAFNSCDSLRWVYYSGSQEQWDVISIGYGNSSLLNAEFHLNGSRPDIASGICGDDLTWVLDSWLTLTISGIGPMHDYSYDSMPWNDYSSFLKLIVIEDGVTSIGDYAFYSCYSLVSVSIPDSVTTIGDYAFYHCNSLTEITIPDGVTSIGSEAFYHCDSLVSVMIGDGVTSIGSEAFAYCDSLTEITIPDSVLIIAVGAFLDCRNLKELYLGSGVGIIRDSAFSDCDSLTEISIPDSVTSIGRDVFAYCDKLAKVNLGDCTAEIPGDTFYGCTSLTGIYVNPGNTAYSNDDAGVLFNKDRTILVRYPTGLAGSYTLPDGVTSIGDYAFCDCDSLTEITLPDIVTSIGDYAFYDCDSLTEITIPDSVTYIGAYAFYSCTKLTSARLSGGITRIDENTFGYCSKLSRVIIPDRVTKIGYLAFWDCNKLLMVCYGGTRDEWKSIYFDSGNDDLTQTLIHYNENNDHLCDTCGYVVGICRDPNRDHNCDRCGAVMNECYDDNGDHYCDICWKELPAGIKRLAGGNRFETATLVADQMKEALGVEQFDAVILANGYNFADALAGSYLSAMKQAPILLTWNGAEKYNYLNDATIAYVKANLKPGGTVYILGGTSAVPASIDKALSGFAIKRMDGANRFETNLMILEEAGVKNGSEILVCTSTNFADSLSASAAGKPILLVFNESGKLYGDQPKFLSNLKNCTFTVIGGENAVSKKLADAVGKYGKVTRLAGANRFETSVMVAEKYFPEATSAVLAYAWDFPDGLCGGGLAYTMKAPLILTMTKYETQAADYIQGQGIKSGVVLGGEKLISHDAVRAIFAMDAAHEIVVK